MTKISDDLVTKTTFDKKVVETEGEITDTTGLVTKTNFNFDTKIIEIGKKSNYLWKKLLKKLI